MSVVSFSSTFSVLNYAYLFAKACPNAGKVAQFVGQNQFQTSRVLLIPNRERNIAWLVEYHYCNQITKYFGHFIKIFWRIILIASITVSCQTYSYQVFTQYSLNLCQHFRLALWLLVPPGLSCLLFEQRSCF